MRLILLYCAALTACGQARNQGNTTPCHVASDDAGSRITCPDGSTSYVPNGRPGKDGETGAAGTPGSAGVDGLDGAAGSKGDQGVKGAQGLPGPEGSEGGSGSDGAPGATGAQGQPGPQGDAGSDGQDGVQGPQGNPGPDGAPGENGSDAAPQTPIAIIDPCGDAPGIYDEVLLRLPDGRILASFSDAADGHNTRFSLLGPGDFITTDGSNCLFSVDALGNVK
jgi:hypothetical protein